MNFFWSPSPTKQSTKSPRKIQKNPRVRKIRVRNSGAGNGCANFMDAWKKCVLSAGKPMSIKFRVLEGGFGGGGSADFIFLGAGIFLTLIGQSRAQRHRFWESRIPNRAILNSVQTRCIVKARLRKVHFSGDFLGVFAFLRIACSHSPTTSPLLHLSFITLSLTPGKLWSIRKILVSVKFVSAILGPEIAAPILWTPGKNAFFLQENPCP